MEKTKLIFKKRSNWVIALVIILAISLPLIVSQVLKQQEVRQHADTAPAITLILSPQTNSVPIAVGSNFTITLLLNTDAGEDIGAIKFTLNYNPSLLSAPSVISQGTGLQVIQSTSAAGKYSAIMVNPNLTPQVTGANLKVITFQFTAKAAGQAQVSIDPNITASAATYSTYVPVNNSSNIIGLYTIKSSH